MALAVQIPSRNRSTHLGFTLIELLVVVSIIGVLSALLLANFVGVRQRAADAARKNNLTQLKKALRLYYNDFQHYPTATSLRVAGCGDLGTADCGVGNEFASGENVYMKELPAEYSYYSSGGETFALRVDLENASDENIASSQSRCAAEITEYGLSVGFGTQGSQDYFYVCQD
jgi:prepilin-type N-terminal cleavage/methylation domain-containing protein